MENENQVKYNAALAATTIFMAAAYYLPRETFLAVFAAGLFLIPLSFFVHIVHGMEV